MKKVKNKARKYSPEFKLRVILDKLNNDLSRNETVRKYWHTKTKRDTNRYTNRVSDWERKYLAEGEAGFMETRKKNKSTEKRNKKEPSATPIDDDLLAEYERLKERNRWLEMENEYLKKLDALIRAEERKNRKKSR